LKTNVEARPLRLGHSPDADDAFMFFGLAKGRVGSTLEFEHKVEDIETLNRRALAGEYEVTAVSVHAFAFVAARYGLIRCGASVGEGYGPRIVAKKPMKLDDLAGQKIAIPGALTTASLTLRLRLQAFQAVPVPFDQVFDEVENGNVAAGLVIHEGQLTYGERGLHLIEDLGAWWRNETGLPLPLGINVVRRDLGPEVAKEVARALKASIQLSLDERKSALEYASAFGRGTDGATLDQFVKWYVNERTLDLGPDGHEAVRRLLQEGAKKGIVPSLSPELLEPLA
jgi:1,4-dihydroxy-6-naphthoate synthase